jgi:indolepyruvate ferredoxin oxidoreductase
VQTIVAAVSDDIEKWNRPEIFPIRQWSSSIATNSMPCRSACARSGVSGPDLRPDLRHRKAPPPQARQDGRSAKAHGHQLAGLRRLRRLRQKSFCVSVLPKETEFGRKREIDQSNCNKDFLREGLLPQLRHRARRQLRKKKGVSAQERLASLPPPVLPALDQPWNILITGVGGTGVVTIGALLGMAGHLEGKGASVLDQTGLAQKGGAVTTHIRIASSPSDIHAVRIAAGEADLVLGCDMVVVNDYWALSKIRASAPRSCSIPTKPCPGRSR